MNGQTWVLNDDMTANVDRIKPSGVGTATALGMSQEEADAVAKRQEKRVPFGFSIPQEKPKAKRRKA